MCMNAFKGGKGLHINGETRLIAIIGNGVRYSGSPVVHNAVFEKMGYNFAYIPFDIERENLEEAVRGMKALGFLGFTVASPFKTQILPYLDEISEVAEIMGAVNTVVIQNGRLLGDNADGSAFMRTLVLNGVNILGRKITVLGSGGAGSAVVTQAALDGVAQIDVFNAKDEFFESGQALIERLKEHSSCAIHIYDLADTDQLRASLAESTLVLNATLAGSEQHPESLLDESYLHDGLFVADTTYLPCETQLIKMARNHGNKVINGAGIFVQQAAMAERLWIGREMPIDYVMETFFLHQEDHQVGLCQDDLYQGGVHQGGSLQGDFRQGDAEF